MSFIMIKDLQVTNKTQRLEKSKGKILTSERIKTQKIETFVDLDFIQNNNIVLAACIKTLYELQKNKS